jgi:photosystem II stability/assembly factor-like uncharacterized protein
LLFPLALVLMALAPVVTAADKNEKNDKEDKKGHPLAGLSLRNIGPAISSGRITDFAVHPERSNEYFVATASGNMWKTTNAGISWSAVMDGEGSYSFGVVSYHPANPLEVWAGSGENNSQRSVAYGDGVYKSVDGGKSWKNVGLGDSEHISQIGFDPRDPEVVYVAAQGPLWNDGGDRGLYKTTDGGESWERILHVDEMTGVNEFAIDPRDPDVIVASSYQRRRHVWVLLNGGPGSGIHKSTDGGKSWREIEAGLPKDDMGRIGLAMAPSAPDTLYAIIEALPDEKGVYRSTDFGESWEKRSDHMATSPQYYNELVVDPHEKDVLYSLDTFSWISKDGGKSFTRLSIEHRHVDDHALWIDPENTDHLSSTVGHPTTPSRSTTSTAARRTTTPSAPPRAPRPCTASPAPTGPSCWAATATSRSSTPTTRTSSTRSTSTAGWPATTSGAASASSSCRSRSRARTRCAGTGTAR